MRWKNSGDPSGGGKSWCLSAAWFLLTSSGGTYYIYTVHSSQLWSHFLTEKTKHIEKTKQTDVEGAP